MAWTNTTNARLGAVLVLTACNNVGACDSPATRGNTGAGANVGVSAVAAAYDAPPFSGANKRSVKVSA
jgi:hypothetical protein